MPKAKKAIVQEWEALLRAVRENQHELGAVAPYHEALLNAHTQAVTCQCLMSVLDNSTADVSARQAKAFGEGHEAAVKLRAFIRSMLGLQNPKLHRYGMKPYCGRPGSRRVAKARKAARA